MEVSPAVLSMAFRFFGRALQFPFDEQTHEYQYLFREMEKQVESEFDEAVAASILDILNFYQGEDMSTLQGEYSRIFSYTEGQVPMVPLFSKDFLPESTREELIEMLYESSLPFDTEIEADSIPNILEYFSMLIEEEALDEVSHFFREIINPAIPTFCSQLYQSSVINFYKELAKGLNILVQQLQPSDSE